MTTQQNRSSWQRIGRVLAVAVLASVATAGQAFSQGQKLETIDVEGQPLAANVERLMQALDFLGTPIPAETTAELQAAAKNRDAKKIQQILDPRVLVVVSLNPESRVKAARGPAAANLQQGGYTPVLVKVVNDSTVTKSLQIASPQAGIVYAGGAAGKAAGDKTPCNCKLFFVQVNSLNRSVKKAYARSKTSGVRNEMVTPPVPARTMSE